MIRREVLELLRGAVTRAAVTPPDRWAKVNVKWARWFYEDDIKYFGMEPIAVGHWERGGCHYVTSFFVKWRGDRDYEFIERVMCCPMECSR